MGSDLGWAQMSSWDWVGLFVVLAFWVVMPILIYLLVSHGPSPTGADDQAMFDWYHEHEPHQSEDTEGQGQPSPAA